MTRLYSQYRPRVVLVNVLLSSLLLAVVAKLFMVQVYHHDDYRRQAARQSTQEAVLSAVRGRIVDRHGEPLTANITHYSFAVDPQVLEDPVALAERLARTFQRSAESYLELMNTGRSFVWLERNVTRAQCEALLAFRTKGFIVRQEMRRRYPYTQIAAQVIGFTDVDNKGIAGIELVYDRLLRGEDGSQLLRRDAKGGVLPYPGRRSDRASHGDQVRLTLDIDYQSIFQEEMALAYERLAPQAIHGVMLDPQTGEIMLGNNDLRDYVLSDLREHLALVAQDTYLFNTTLRENLLIARPDATDDQVEVALEMSGLSGFVETLPDGLETVVGERGAQLSGGQRQRIAIGRAFLKDAPILVLDEATSHLDVVNEQMVRGALDRLASDRTTLVIAHRLSTVMDADLIVVMDRGKIVESGTHSQLLERGGLYAQLVSHQLSRAGVAGSA